MLYVLFFLISKKQLPWVSGLTTDFWKNFHHVRKLKKTTSPEEICGGKLKPFLTVLQYCYQLK